MTTQIQEVDRLEIVTLQDNYVDLVAKDDTEIIKRAMPLKGVEFTNSILAEHGFSALVTVLANGQSRSILFDFGFSEHGAATNARSLNLDLTSVEALALSHGHMDHIGGLLALAEMTGRKGIELYLHPVAFRQPRYMKAAGGFKVFLPSASRHQLQTAGIMIRESTTPTTLLDGHLMFLGEIPRKTEFEKGAPYLFHEEGGQEHWDKLEDDSALVANVRGQGLVVLSGCAHAGIVNTVRYAREVTGVDKIHVVMGGFHLTGPDFASVVDPTIQALKDLNPKYVVPTHCSGRKAIMKMEQNMPESFLLNMAGTKLIFSA